MSAYKLVTGFFLFLDMTNSLLFRFLRGFSLSVSTLPATIAYNLLSRSLANSFALKTILLFAIPPSPIVSTVVVTLFKVC